MFHAWRARGLAVRPDSVGGAWRGTSAAASTGRARQEPTATEATVAAQVALGLTNKMRIVIICQMNPKPANAPGAPLDDAPPLPRQASAKVATPRTSSRALLGDARELVIDHEGREYRLRITQNGKLILTA